MLRLLTILPFLFQTISVETVLGLWSEAVNLEKLKSINTMTTRATVKEGPFEYEIIIFKKRPDKFRQEVMTEGQKSVQILSGDNAWGLDFAGRKRKLNSAISSQLQSIAPIDPLLSEIPINSLSLKIEDEHWLLVGQHDNRSYSFWIDKRSHQLVKYSENDAQERITILQEVIDYKEIEGMQIPVLIKQTINRGLKSTERIYQVQSIEVNERISDSKF